MTGRHATETRRRHKAAGSGRRGADGLRQVLSAVCILTVCVLTGVALPSSAALPLPPASSPSLPASPGLGGQPSGGEPGILPGQSIGPAALGMHADELGAALGAPTPSRSGQLVFPRWQIVATMTAGAATQLSTTNPALHTPTGAGVGTARAQVVALVGDFNQAVTQAGGTTTELFPFQGIGFLFRDYRASVVFVVQRIPLVPSVTAPRPGQGTSEPGQAPTGVTAAAPAAPSTGSSTGKAELTVRGLAETINQAGVLQVTGQVANSGNGPSGAITLTATFNRQSGASIQQQVAVPGPIGPGATASFGVSTVIGTDLIIRYTIAGAPESGVTELSRSIPFAEYAAFAVHQVQINVSLGAPVGTGNGVQAIVSITSTGAIPPGWVRDVTVQIPFSNGGSTTVHLTPGQTPTVVVPSVPGPGVNNGQLFGTPQIVSVTLGTS